MSDAWLTISVVILTLACLVGTRLAPDAVLMAALTFLIVTGVLEPGEGLSGFGNEGLATVAVMYVVVSGLISTGAVHALGAKVFGRPNSIVIAQLRMMLPVTFASAFLNNTPVVAMFIPVIEDWSRRCRISVSRLMMPLSYAAILGGTCTLIGTSTNLVVHGLVLDFTSLGPMGFFEIGAIGLPTAILGFLYITLCGRWLLPDRKPPLQEVEKAREYAVELLVESTSPLVGKSIEDAGLRHLPGAFLAEIERANTLLPAVAPSERLQAGDRLLFVGVVQSVVDLLRMRGLVPAPEQLFKLDSPRPERCVIEVVVAERCPVVGHTIRDGEFRSRYDAVVIAAARNGERLTGKIGDIVLQAGDTLLLEARPAFLNQQSNSRDFLLVSEVQGAALPRHERAWVAIVILFAMVLAAATGLLSMLEASLLAAGGMILARCTTISAARNGIDWSVIIMIGAALGLGKALQTSGAAAWIAHTWMGLAGDNPWIALAAMYAITACFTELITNNAAAALVFPIAIATAEGLGVSPWPFIVVIMMAASASFATPIGYQTNLMVYGPGGYRFTDYLRFGIPLTLLIGAFAVILIPRIWPFHPA
ncbi:MAG TPA: SLC13 family permease [Gammaproteobacteria bacterium]|nr:SLC13 family permease [Gammaproteobacteria bacterium]